MAKTIHLFKCSCKSSKEASFRDFKKHLAEVHGLATTEDLSGKREMVMHMDGPRWYSSQYKWTLNNGLTFTEYFESSRGKDTVLH